VRRVCTVLVHYNSFARTAERAVQRIFDDFEFVCCFVFISEREDSKREFLNNTKTLFFSLR